MWCPKAKVGAVWTVSVSAEPRLRVLLTPSAFTTVSDRARATFLREGACGASSAGDVLVGIWVCMLNCLPKGCVLSIWYQGQFCGVCSGRSVHRHLGHVAFCIGPPGGKPAPSWRNCFYGNRSRTAMSVAVDMQWWMLECAKHRQGSVM